MNYYLIVYKNDFGSFLSVDEDKKFIKYLTIQEAYSQFNILIKKTIENSLTLFNNFDEAGVDPFIIRVFTDDPKILTKYALTYSPELYKSNGNFKLNYSVVEVKEEIVELNVLNVLDYMISKNHMSNEIERKTHLTLYLEGEPLSKNSMYALLYKINSNLFLETLDDCVAVFDDVEKAYNEFTKVKELIFLKGSANSDFVWEKIVQLRVYILGFDDMGELAPFLFSNELEILNHPINLRCFRVTQNIFDHLIYIDVAATIELEIKSFETGISVDELARSQELELLRGQERAYVNGNNF